MLVSAPDSQWFGAIACTRNSCINELETGRVGQNVNRLTDRQTYDLQAPFVQPRLILVTL